MDTQVSAEKTDLRISCREARLLLNVIPINRDTREMNELELAACKHYAHCKECTGDGLAKILDYKMSHQEAILIWAENPGPLWHGFLGLANNVSTLHVIMAIEHVWGKYEWENSMGGHGYDNFTACQERSCQTLNYFWRSTSFDSGVCDLFPKIFDIFLDEEWPLDELFSIQRERVDDVLKDMSNGKLNMIREEMKAHVDALQKVALR